MLLDSVLVFFLIGSHEDKGQEVLKQDRNKQIILVECESHFVVLERNWCAVRALELVSTEQSVHRAISVWAGSGCVCSGQ